MLRFQRPVLRLARIDSKSEQVSPCFKSANASCESTRACGYELKAINEREFVDPGLEVLHVEMETKVQEDHAHTAMSISSG